MADAVSMPSAFEIVSRFQWLRRFNASRFYVLRPFEWLRRFYGLCPFLGLAYAELKVNFVEGFAVLCLRRLSLTLFQWATPVSGFQWLRRFCIKGFNDSMLSCAVNFISTECF